jgi:hypothetical protein
VTWQDYRTGQYDIQLSESTDGGLTWSSAKSPVTPDRGKDHYFPAIDTVSSPQGNGELGQKQDRVGISYYRTDRVANENTTPMPDGFQPCPRPAPTVCQPDVATKSSDYTLAGGTGLNTPYAFQRVSPAFPPPDGNQAGFIGDYSALTIVNSTAHPMWADTRNATPFAATSIDFPFVVHDEDVFTDALPVPSGGGEDNQNG